MLIESTVDKCDNSVTIPRDANRIETEMVSPALRLLESSDKAFKGTQDEFATALEKYLKGELPDLQDAILWAAKAFESTMKAICTIRNWPFDSQKATAKVLLEIVFQNHLLPEYLKCI